MEDLPCPARYLRGAVNNANYTTVAASPREMAHAPTGDAPHDARLPVQKLLIAGTGAIGCAFLPGWVVWLRRTFSVDIRAILSRNAERFVTLEALAALTGRPAIGESNLDNFRGRILHVELAE